MDDLDLSTIEMEENDSDGSDEEGLPETMVDSSGFTRTDLHEGEISDEETGETIYGDADSNLSAETVDPRLLFGTPSLNEIRWYYRYTLARTLVDKPVKDAYKNGFTIGGMDYDEDDFLAEYIPAKIEAKIKARRDGLSALFFVLSDDNEVHEPPSDNVGSFNGFIEITVDKLEDNQGIDHQKIVDGFEDIGENDHDKYVVRDSGLVIRNDWSSEDHEEIMGYAVKKGEDKKAQFVHADRCQHFSFGETVDCDVNDYTIAKWEGSSALLPALIYIKELTKGVWALGQTLYRYSSPLYVVNAPEHCGDEEFDEVNEQIEYLSSKSDITLPSGWEADSVSNQGELDPSNYIDKLVQQTCSSLEMTESVLMGTMTGTVSGSATDVKNYFNQVQRDRTGEEEDEITESLQMVNDWNPSISDADPDEEIKWGALFKMDTLERMDSMVKAITATSNAINSYTLTPNEAREIINEQWSELDVDIDLEDLTDEQMKELEEVNERPTISEEERWNPSESGETPSDGQNGGGNTEGPNEQTAADPSEDS